MIVWVAARAVGALDVGDLALPLAAIVHRCLEWVAPITVKQLATWIGVSQRDIKAALAGMQVLPVTIEGHADEAWLLARDLDELVELREAPPREYLFLPFADTLLAIHDGPAVHVDPAHHGVRVKTWGGRGKEEPLGAVNHLGHRPLLLGDPRVEPPPSRQPRHQPSTHPRGQAPRGDVDHHHVVRRGHTRARRAAGRSGRNARPRRH